MIRARDLKPYMRFAFAFNRYLKTTLSEEQARNEIERRLANREQALGEIIDKYIYGYPRSPYLPLLKAAGWRKGAVLALLEKEGVEETLRQLAESGVYVTLGEFKGTRMATRGGQSFEFIEADFDNPHLAHHLEVQSGGTRSAGTRVPIRLDFTAALAADTAILFDEYSLWENTQAIWLPLGGAAGVALLIYSKLGRVPLKWFSQLTGSELNARYRWVTRFMSLWGRLAGTNIPTPEFAPLSSAPQIARWMAEMVKRGQPACVTTYASSAVRAGSAAVDQGLDLTGSTFITIGEPLTQVKRRTIERSGAKVIVRYAMTEAGIIGYGCANPSGPDDLHLLRGNLAAIQQDARVGDGDVKVDAFLFTSLLPSAPKILLNVQSGDYGTMTQRECGCLFGRLGYGTHVSNVRSFEKLTGEGVTFAKTSLIRVLEEVLPSRFGGQPTDYQVVEEEMEGGLPRLYLSVSPAVGEINEGLLKQTFLDHIGGGLQARKDSTLWKQAEILKIRRANPASTKMGKVQPFHLERAKQSR